MKQCEWYEQCGKDADCCKCDHYSALCPDIDDYIENERLQFRGEWFDYMEVLENDC